MIYIKSFKNYEEFKELFGIVEHGNGVKSRKNKILLACLKDRNLLHWWLSTRDVLSRHSVNLKVLNKIDYLSVTNMNGLKAFAKAMLYDIPIALGRWRIVAYWTKSFEQICFEGFDWKLISTTMELDASNGFCLDGDMKAVRYVNTERDKVFKMKAGKFITRCIEELPEVGNVMPEQMKRWLGEEFAREWQSHAEQNNPNGQYELHVDDDFDAIYDSDRCVGDFRSCMTDRGYHDFYTKSVDAKAAYLTRQDGKIVARCIIYTNVEDGYGEEYRLAERQYATGQDDRLKQILVDKLIEAGEIDGYKRVGAGCWDTDDFVLNNGESMSHLTLFIKCELEPNDTLSFQDSFQYFCYDEQIAYNNSNCSYDAELSKTEGLLEMGEWSEWNESWIIENPTRDEYYDDWIREDQAATMYYHGREILVNDEKAGEDCDLCWSDRDGVYYLADECVKAVDLDDYIDIDDACEDIDGEWQLEEDCEWSDYHNAYILSERCHYSEAVGDYVDEDRAETCPVCGDWIPEDYDGIIVSTIVDGEFCCDECRLKAEAAYRKVHALRVVS